MIFLKPLALLSIFLGIAFSNTPEVENAMDINLNGMDFISSLENVLWMERVNSKSDDLAQMYTKDAYKVLDDGSYLNGNEVITAYYKKSNLDITSIDTDTLMVANSRRGLEYEIGSFYDSNDQHYKQILVWETGESDRKRVLEIIEKVSRGSSHTAAINDARARWMGYCNAHDVSGLANNIYSENTLYYNHKPLVIGRDQLIKEYQYMTRPSYSLKLTPIVSEAINETTVFEIGQCAEGYNGKYIIVWKKAENGNWEVFLDSNI